MRKVASVSLFAVFVPSLLLAWLAVRSICDQELVLERQRSLLYQNVADTLARNVESAILAHQHEFAARVESMLAGTKPAAIAPAFDDRLRTNWPLAEVGFVACSSGPLPCPSPTSTSFAARSFLTNNASFLANGESVEIYWSGSGVESGNETEKSGPEKTNENSIQIAAASKMPQKNVARKVVPQQSSPPEPGDQPPEGSLFSKVAPVEAEFKQLIGGESEGTLARFVNNKLSLLVWRRSSSDSNYVFGAQIALPKLVEELRAQIENVDAALRKDICVALLDDNVRPAALSQPRFRADWKHPFVATEIGEELPHWELAVYLLHPADLNHAAQTIKLILGLLIAVLLLSIAGGSWLMVRSIQKELELARQKTDFVSNVSHELKTPLTSIRMFSELLASQRVIEPAKHHSYLNIINAETARLTRLINNVLDFSRMERGEKKYDFKECDLARITRETAESYRPHLEHSGFKFGCSMPSGSLPIRADADAIAQIILNMLSNAEKYSNGQREIQVEAARTESSESSAEVKVMDRGPGVPRGSEKKIFEKFYRAHESLSSGIQGSGLGLTLARQIARAHGGDIVYEPRNEGGSCFILRLPLASG